MLSSASDKVKLFAENFSKNSNLDDLGIFLHVFPSRTNLKLHYTYVTPKMVKTVIMSLDLSKASGPDCIPVVVLKNCEPELSYILAKVFHKCFKVACRFEISYIIEIKKSTFASVEIDEKENVTSPNFLFSS